MSLAHTTPTLPVELLAQIIIEASANDPSVIAVVMSVSRLWYYTTINQPRLWNKVSLNLSPSPSSHVPAMQTARRCIERSGCVDLYITIRITNNEPPCDCYQDDGNPVCQRCCQQWMAYIDSQRGPIEVLAGSDGNHLTRWCRLDIRNDMTSEDLQAAWVDRVLSPLIDGRPTPHLQTLSFRGWHDVRLSFCHTPLLQEVTLQGAPHLHIANWGGVKRLRIANTPPRSLVENGAYTVMTHLILHMPIRCSQLTLPNVTDLEILERQGVPYILEFPALPRVQNILISTIPNDELHNFPLHRYPTMRRLSLRYPSDRRPPILFAASLFGFFMSSCANLEELDVSYPLLSIVKSTARYLPKLKKVFVVGKEMGSAADSSICHSDR